MNRSVYVYLTLVILIGHYFYLFVYLFGTQNWGVSFFEKFIFRILISQKYEVDRWRGIFTNNPMCDISRIDDVHNKHIIPEDEIKSLK
jgi:hypothetical protein